MSGSSVAYRVARTALDHYDRDLSTKGKPKENEWTVYAAIVAVSNGSSWVVTSATGTKCTATRHNGCVLHDSHAEVLAPLKGLAFPPWSPLIHQGPLSLVKIT